LRVGNSALGVFRGVSTEDKRLRGTNAVTGYQCVGDRCESVPEMHFLWERKSRRIAW
jgi:hypothetical protein